MKKERKKEKCTHHHPVQKFTLSGIVLPSGASVNVFTFCNNCMSPSIALGLVWKDGSQNHTVTVGKGSNMQKMLENQRMCRSWRIFLKNSRLLNCSGATRTWTTITKQKNSRGSSRKQHRLLRCKLLGVIFYEFSYYFVLWSIYKHM